jgi:hypothetical protein
VPRIDALLLEETMAPRCRYERQQQSQGIPTGRRSRAEADFADQLERLPEVK